MTRYKMEWQVAAHEINQNQVLKISQKRKPVKFCGFGIRSGLDRHDSFQKLILTRISACF